MKKTLVFFLALSGSAICAGITNSRDTVYAWPLDSVPDSVRTFTIYNNSAQDVRIDTLLFRLDSSSTVTGFGLYLDSLPNSHPWSSMQDYGFRFTPFLRYPPTPLAMLPLQQQGNPSLPIRISRGGSRSFYHTLFAEFLVSTLQASVPNIVLPVHGMLFFKQSTSIIDSLRLVGKVMYYGGTKRPTMLRKIPSESTDVNVYNIRGQKVCTQSAVPICLIRRVNGRVTLRFDGLKF